jgi:hypothetical protein
MKSRAGCSQAPAPSLTASRALRILFFLPLPSSRIFDPPVAPLQLSTFTLSFKLILPPYLRTQHYTTSKLSSSVTALIKRQVFLASSPASFSQVWVPNQLLLPHSSHEFSLRHHIAVGLLASCGGITVIRHILLPAPGSFYSFATT